MGKYADDEIRAMVEAMKQKTPLPDEAKAFIIWAEGNADWFAPTVAAKDICLDTKNTVQIQVLPPAPGILKRAFLNELLAPLIFEYILKSIHSVSARHDFYYIYQLGFVHQDSVHFPLIYKGYLPIHEYGH